MIIDLNCGSKTSRSSSDSGRENLSPVNSLDVRGLSAVVCRRDQRCCQCDQLIWGGWQLPPAKQIWNPRLSLTVRYELYTKTGNFQDAI